MPNKPDRPNKPNKPDKPNRPNRPNRLILSGRPLFRNSAEMLKLWSNLLFFSQKLLPFNFYF